ncbi:DUF4397 domain-containing protein [Aquipuribacter nitratireducens]|uniref:DUF4397 domain-containing protein n=1 Tax=Aquipuribacter nitratireducens TaxID=650104 RepID=A0ABW0GJD7_9MICO
MARPSPAVRASASGSSRPRALRAAALVVATAVAVVLLPVGAAGASTATAYLRAAHLVPDLGAMDVRLSPFSGEGDPEALAPVLEITASYGAVGGYEALPPGRYAVALRPAGSDPSSDPVLSLTFDLTAGQAYTVAGLGSSDDPSLELLEDELTRPADGTARVRLLGASLEAPTAQVSAVDGPALGTARLGEATDYTQAPAGPWTLRAEGDGASGESEVDLDAGDVYTLLVLDGDDGLQLQAVLDAGGVGTVPVGAAATGLGGLADGAGGPGPSAGVVLAALAAGALLVLLAAVPLARPARRRAEPPATR